MVWIKFFVNPTVFDRVTRICASHAKRSLSSCFGLRVKDFDEAMQVANDCEMDCRIVLRTSSRVFRFVDEIETGMTHINRRQPARSAYPLAASKARHRRSRTGIDGARLLHGLKVVYVDYTGRKREGNLYE